MHRSIASTFVVLALAACASKPPATAEPAKPKPVVQTIAIVPAVAPASYSIRNRSPIGLLIPIANLATYADGRSKSELLTQKMKTMSAALSVDFSDAMASDLRRLGYQVVVLHDLKRDPADPEDVNYAPLFERADAVLHLKFADIGLESPLSSASYLPRLNARGMLYAKGLDDSLYDSTIYYGIDARAGKDWGIVATNPVVYDSFDALVANLESVHQTFQDGARAISQRMAGQVHAAIR